MNTEMVIGLSRACYNLIKMSAPTKQFDRVFFAIVAILVLSGLFIFVSTATGLLTNSLSNFLLTVGKQILLGIVLGGVCAIFFSRIYYKNWEKWATYIFIFSILITLLVFVPELSIAAKGARRWIDLGGFLSFQPSEILKLGFVIYFASYLSKIKGRIQTLKYGLVYSIGIVFIPTAILLAQPDNGTLLSIWSAWIAMFLLAGGRWKHVFLIILLGIMALGLVVYVKPYAMQRIITFMDPLADPLGSGYQTRQALIAIGSGQISGRGFGQSIQKFDFLPEPMGDSIFAVAAEEFGFVGSAIIILLFMAFSLRGLKLASRGPDSFGRLLAAGIVILISSQSFINIGAMLGILPLTGIPLIFVSHGGTAILMALAEVGIVLNISRYI
jgi:cell division protein FtsW